MSFMGRSVDVTFNAAVLAIVGTVVRGGYVSANDAPYSLITKTSDYKKRLNMVRVEPASAWDEDVFGDAETGIAYRAWVQSVEVRIGQEARTTEGAKKVFVAMSAQMLTEFGWEENVVRWMTVLHALTVGVAEYTEQQGLAPINPKEFVQTYVADRDLAVEERW